MTTVIGAQRPAPPPELCPTSDEKRMPHGSGFAMFFFIVVLIYGGIALAYCL
ncbi:MAG: hypothetical protein ABIT47_01670 [Candidatus Paceibacterota bacterium]